MLTLYFAPGSSSMAPHIALYEIGAPFDARPVSFHRRETHTPGFLALNPEGKVPVLLVDGRPMTEVLAILFYLARRFPEAGLLPGELEGEAQALSWMSFIAATLHAARWRGPEEAHKVFRLADQKLGPREWVLDDYSVADIHLFRLFWRFRPRLKPGPGDYPSLQAHYDRMMARPAVQRTIEAETAIGYELPA